MNLLEEKGMSNAFAEKICDIATEYEHDLYTKFLENMKSFINTKWNVWIKNCGIQNVVSLFNQYYNNSLNSTMLITINTSISCQDLSIHLGYPLLLVQFHLDRSSALELLSKERKDYFNLIQYKLKNKSYAIYFNTFPIDLKKWCADINRVVTP